MKHIGLLPHLKALDHKLNDLFHKILFCIKSSIPVHSDWAHGSLLLSRNYHSESVTIASANLLTAAGHLCHKWPHIFSACLSGALEVARYVVLVLVGFVLFILSNNITSLIPCCDVRYHFRVKVMFGSFRLSILW